MEQRENSKSVTQWIKTLAFLTAIEALAAAFWLLSLPKEGTGAFWGYSTARLLNSLLLVGLAGIFFAAGVWKHIRDWLSKKISVLACHNSAYWVISSILLFICGLVIIITLKLFFNPATAHNIIIRLMPLCVWTFLSSIQIMFLLSYFRVRQIGVFEAWKGLIYLFWGSGIESDGASLLKISNGLLVKLFVIVGGMFLLGWFLFTYAGGTSSWDELGYMTLAMTPQAIPHILHRYAHIYLLKLFFTIAGGDPFVGSRLYWAFVVSATAGLIGFIASNFSARNFLYGLIALSFFFTQERIWRYSGVPYADFSAMMWTTAALTAYLNTDNPKYAKIFSILLGLFVFIAFKSTDLGIVSAILWLGLGFTREGKYSLKVLLARITWVLRGVIIGQCILCFLDYLFLKDAFFSLRWESWQTWLEFNGVSSILFYHLGGAIIKNIGILGVMIGVLLLLGGVIVWGIRKGLFKFLNNINYWVPNVFIGLIVLGIWVYLQFFDFPPVPADKSYLDVVGWGRYLLSIFWVVICLFFISFLKQKQYGLSPEHLYSWVYPLTLFVIVGVMTGVSRRYFLSAVPTLVILSPQFIKFPPIITFRDWKKTSFTVLLPSIGISLVFFFFLYLYLAPYPPGGMAFLKQHLAYFATWDVGIYGVFSLLLLLTALAVYRWRVGFQVVVLTCVLVLTFPDIYYYATPFVRGDQIQLLERRFFPLQVSSPYFACKEDKRIFVSSNIFQDYGCFAPNAGALQSMFKLYYRCNVNAENITTYGNPSLSRSGEIVPMEADVLLTKPYDYLYLHSSDWQRLDDSVRHELSERYQVVKAWWKAEPPIDDFTTYGVNEKPVAIVFLARKQ